MMGLEFAKAQDVPAAYVMRLIDLRRDVKRGIQFDCMEVGLPSALNPSKLHSAVRNGEEKISQAFLLRKGGTKWYPVPRQFGLFQSVNLADMTDSSDGLAA